jgi:hypothetical protein
MDTQISDFLELAVKLLGAQEKRKALDDEVFFLQRDLQCELSNMFPHPRGSKLLTWERGRPGDPQACSFLVQDGGKQIYKITFYPEASDLPVTVTQVSVLSLSGGITQ